MSSAGWTARLREPAKRWIGAAARLTCEAGCRVVGAVARQAESAVTAEPRRVLVIAPHPDDEAIGCGGTMLRHAHAGAQVCVVWITDGRRSRALRLPPDEMARRREDEAAAAARCLQAARAEWLGLPEGDWDETELSTRLTDIFRRISPTLVYAPSAIDFHPEHRRVALALSALLSRAGTSDMMLRVYPVQVPLTPVLGNRVVDVTMTLPRLLSAFDRYVTQRANMSRAIRQRAYAARLYGTGQFAEEFLELTAEGYVRLHEALASPAVPWRGLREHPVFDPLAYLGGLSARRHLRRVLDRRPATTSS